MPDNLEQQHACPSCGASLWAGNRLRIDCCDSCAALDRYIEEARRDRRKAAREELKRRARAKGAAILAQAEADGTLARGQASAHAACLERERRRQHV